MTKYSGRGRFSVVHFATRKRDMMPCALKKINCNPSDLPGVGGGGGGGGVKESVSPEKCLKEVGLLRSLDHPNIIKYLDSFLHESELYIILEWAGKGDLKELISEQRKIGFHFSEGAVWTLFSQVTISSPLVCLSVPPQIAYCNNLCIHTVSSLSLSLLHYIISVLKPSDTCMTSVSFTETSSPATCSSWKMGA
jgi:serine/threonine protein kinase